ncbi:MAG: GNAT family N-acetyltransferase, partial [Ktedonobacteraceae bacterium]|nr:GNAT family N-acetyltransferase [Ktedonobacteraceae bacterium]
MHRQGLEQSGVYPGPNYVYKDMQDIKTSYIDAAGSTFLVAEYDGRVIGMGACKPAQNPERAEIVRISVDSEHQGLGVGTRIQLELLKEAQIMGYRYADLTTSVEQISAQVIYTKLGFK